MWRMRFDRYPAMKQFAIPIPSDSIGLSERSMSFKVLSTMHWYCSLCAFIRTPMNQIEDIWARIIIVEIATAWCNGPSSISCLFSISLALLSLIHWRFEKLFTVVCKYCKRDFTPFVRLYCQLSLQTEQMKRFQVGELMRNFHAESYQSLTHSLVASNECVHVCLCVYARDVSTYFSQANITKKFSDDVKSNKVE